MAIKETKALKANCDKCNKEYISQDGSSIFSDLDYLKHEIQDSRWKNQDNKLLCLKCFDVYSVDNNIYELKISAK